MADRDRAEFEKKIIRQMGQITNAADLLAEAGHTASASLVRAVTISGDEVKRTADLLDRQEKLVALNTLRLLALGVAQDGGDFRPLFAVIAEIQQEHLEPPLPVQIQVGFGGDQKALTKENMRR